MKRVKIFSSSSYGTLQSQINEWIKEDSQHMNLDSIDIKFSTAMANSIVSYSALVLYEI